MRAFHYGVTGQLDKAVDAAVTARAIPERTPLADEWTAALPLILIRVYNCLEDFPAVAREAATALAAPLISEKDAKASTLAAIPRELLPVYRMRKER